MNGAGPLPRLPPAAHSHDGEPTEGIADVRRKTRSTVFRLTGSRDMVPPKAGETSDGYLHQMASPGSLQARLRH